MSKELNACGVILAGGGSTRMGKDKAWLNLGGQPVVARILKELQKSVSTVVMNQNKGPDLPIPSIQDIYQDAGPLGGLHTVMNARGEEWFFLSACDTPFIHESVYNYLSSFADQTIDAVVPEYEGRLQLLSGIYRKSCLPIIETLLLNGERKVSLLLEQVHSVYVTDFQPLSREVVNRHFFNMNTPEDYRKAQEICKIL
ncbi:molybdenum cofactor guanylyltransferase [Halobacillus halophilus]|uniref:molybdenum cofactor guanylyltransferase n=1 Tax=Halobacillus halophilus TaxID=1570 RepID=UPI001CD2A5BF|nr:molybdenum cofactor guanylyltransferase [Halobacillus halophilus]MCA1009408.1 molybdenum cofactor guanylyltransferase [Halobacillus halophilus]